MDFPQYDECPLCQGEMVDRRCQLCDYREPTVEEMLEAHREVMAQPLKARIEALEERQQELYDTIVQPLEATVKELDEELREVVKVNFQYHQKLKELAKEIERLEAQIQVLDVQHIRVAERQIRMIIDTMNYSSILEKNPGESQ